MKYSRIFYGISKIIPFASKATRIKDLFKIVREKFGNLAADEIFSLISDSVFYICVPAPLRIAFKCTILFTESLIVVADSPGNLNMKIWIDSLIQLFEGLTDKDVDFIQYMRHTSAEWIQNNPDFVKDVVFGL